jgi:hypothetical protein
VKANHQIPWMATGKKCQRSELTSQSVACSKEMESSDGRIDKRSERGEKKAQSFLVVSTKIFSMGFFWNVG